MRLNLSIYLSRLLLISILCSACLPFPTSQPGPSIQPEPTSFPTAAIRLKPTLQATSPDILAACPVDEQALAMRGSHIPDWQRTGITACYLLSLDLTGSSGIYPGSETLIYTNNTGTSLSEIVLRVYPNAQNIYGGKMNIRSAKKNETDLLFEYFLSDQTGLRIHLDRPLLPEDTARIDLKFDIEVPLDFGSGKSYGIFNFSSSGPELNLANWYPILAVYSDGEWQADPVLMGGDAVTSQTALYRVLITAPTEWQIASTGTQIQQVDESGLSKHIFVSGPARDFMVAASPAFVKRQAQLDDITIAHWGLLDSEPGWNIALDASRTALAYYENSFGPYPFNELDVVAASLQNASGVEYPGLILITNTSYQSTNQSGFLKFVIAHEIAHQWWYSLVGNDVLQNPWQDEALATYTSLMFMNTSSPGIDFIGRYKLQVEEYEKTSPGQPISQALAAFQDRVSEYGLVVYVKGALFFADVRDQLGDAVFKQALSAYYQDYKYQLAYPEDLLNSFTETCHCSLKELEQEYGVRAVNP